MDRRSQSANGSRRASVSALERLTGVLARLPGIGRKSAERMALRLVASRDGLLAELAAALREAQESVAVCSRCGAITTQGEDPCALCTSASRDGSRVCVVEEPNDILMIERSGGFRGRYHALMGRLSPMKGEGPQHMRLNQLRARIREEGIREVILALNTDVEGDATASYIEEFLDGEDLVVSRLAFGLPAGSGIAYSDPVTLARAIRGRTMHRE